MKKYNTKQYIEKSLKENIACDVRIYDTFKDMIKNEKNLNTSNEKIFDYTDGLFAYNNSKCYVLEGKIYPNEQYGTNIIFINYDKNEIPTAIFVENNFCEIANYISKLVKNS